MQHALGYRLGWWLAVAALGCDADVPDDTGTRTQEVTMPVFAGTGGAAGFGGSSGNASIGGGAGTAGSLGAAGAAGDGEFAGAGGSAGNAADAGARTDAGAAMTCPPMFECVTEPIFNLLSGCLPVGGGLPPACTTDADCVKAGLPGALCLMEEETGLNGCAQVCTP